MRKPTWYWRAWWFFGYHGLYQINWWWKKDKFWRKEPNPKKSNIYYKRDWQTNTVVLRPDNFYWRLRYWIKQYTILVTTWILKPIYHLNYSCWRINEAERIEAIFQIERMGLMVKDPEPFMAHIEFPKYIRNNRDRLTKAFKHFRNFL